MEKSSMRFAWTWSVPRITVVGAVLCAACASDLATIPPFYDELPSGGTGGLGVGGSIAGAGGSLTRTDGSKAGTGQGGSIGGTASATGGAGAGGGGGGASGGSFGIGGSAPGVSGSSTGGSAGPAAGGTAGTSTTGGRGGMGYGGRVSSGGAGGGSAGAAGGGNGTFASVAAIVNSECAASTCHGGRRQPSLSSSNLTTLYNTLKNTAVRQCGSDHLATANDPANSALLELVQQQCGTFIMPDGCNMNPCIDAASLATITAWIQAGAPGP